MAIHMRKRLTNQVSRVTLLLFFLALSMGSHAQVSIEGDIANGKQLFKQCAACHKLDKKAIGPALRDVTERRSMEWLTLWIRDNQALRESGDADAIAIFEGDLTFADGENIGLNSGDGRSSILIFEFLSIQFGWDY